jgi:hypothetical protein
MIGLLGVPVAPPALPASCDLPIWTPQAPAIIRPAEHALLKPGAFRPSTRAEGRAILADLVRSGRMTREQARGAIVFIPWIQAELLPYPVVEATNTGNHGSASSYDVPLPASIAAGNLLVIFVAIYKNSAVGFSDPGGWTNMFSVVPASGNLRNFAAWYKWASGSEGAAVTVTASTAGNWAATAYRISGAGHIDYSAASDASGSTYPSSPNVAPSFGNQQTLWLTATGAIFGSHRTFTAPTNYGDIIQDAYYATYDIPRVASATRQLKASSEDPAEFGAGTYPNSWGAATVAIAG